ncbi:hypothetical protein Q0P14_14805, partial [Staphylococcus aureus]|nr:hypothetical protein [Staphylococcus aureus]
QYSGQSDTNAASWPDDYGKLGLPQGGADFTVAMPGPGSGGNGSVSAPPAVGGGYSGAGSTGGYGGGSGGAGSVSAPPTLGGAYTS